MRLETDLQSSKSNVLFILSQAVRHFLLPPKRSVRGVVSFLSLERQLFGLKTLALLVSLESSCIVEATVVFVLDCQEKSVLKQMKVQD